MSLYEQKKSPLEVPVFLVKRKPKSCWASDSTSSSSHRVSAFLVSSGYQLCAGLSLRQEPVARTATEMQRKQQRTALRWHFTLQTGAFTDRARILAAVFATSPVAGQEAKDVETGAQRTRKLRFAARACFYSKAFHKLWPRFSPMARLCSVQDEDWRTKVAWSHLYASPLWKQLGTGWSPGRFKSPRARVAAGDC